MTTSRMGIMGSFLLSNFSLELGFDNAVSRLGFWLLVVGRQSLAPSRFAISVSRTTRD